MPINSRILLAIFFAFGVLTNVAFAQKFEHGANLSKHTIGYTISYSYPKMADGSNNTRIESDFNFGISGGVEWGKYYDSGISFMIAPTIYYSDFSNSLKAMDLYHGITDKLIYRTEYTIQFKEFGVSIPLLYEFKIFKSFRLGAGANISIPIVSSCSTKQIEYDYYYSIAGHDVYRDPPLKKEYNYQNDYLYKPSLGVQGKVLYQINITENVESFISLEYWYDVSFSSAMYAHKTRFSLSYIHRIIKLKDVREKWDRYWIKKRNYKG